MDQQRSPRSGRGDSLLQLDQELPDPDFFAKLPNSCERWPDPDRFSVRPYRPPSKAYTSLDRPTSIGYAQLGTLAAQNRLQGLLAWLVGTPFSSVFSPGERRSLNLLKGCRPTWRSAALGHNHSKTSTGGTGTPKVAVMVAASASDFNQGRALCAPQLNISGVLSIEVTHGIAWLDAHPKDVQPRPLIGPHQSTSVHGLSAQKSKQALARIERLWLLPQLDQHWCALQ